MAGAPKDNINAKKGLTLKQKRFCKEYIIDFNATQAAIRSGYSKKTAQEQSSRLLLNVIIQDEIKKLQDKTAQKLEITHEMLTAEWAKMAFSNISEAYKNWMTLEEFEALKKEKPELMSCIQEISTKTEYKKEEGRVKGKVEWIRLKFYDKQKALENLGKNIGYYAEDNKQGTEFLKKFFSNTKIILENGVKDKK